MATDVILINIAIYGALLIRFDGAIPGQYIDAYINLAPFFTLIVIAVFYLAGLYNRLWQYASIGELVTVITAVTVGMAINVTVAYFLMDSGSHLLPRSVFIISWVLNIVIIGGSRLGWRVVRDYGLKIYQPTGGKPVLIVGAGDAGVLVAKELKSHYNGKINIVGFVDDDIDKQKLKILSLPVLGDRNDIPKLVSQFAIQEIIIAMPSAKRKVIREIVTVCQDTEAMVKILPGMFELIDGDVSVNKIREVQVEDLLGRDPVKLDLESITQYLHGQVVLVTGAGGSIGSELCRQIINYSPRKLLLLDNCENNVYDIEMELKNTNPHVKQIPLVKDVQDKKAIEEIFKVYKPQVVFHAAAHKHVPLMEANPEEAIKNNVMGTYNVARLADLYASKKFVLISTDKAVNPTSVMGATKRVAEMFIQHLDKTSNTNFVAVRFGNVLGSRGSVVPLFKKQIAEGGPLTVTHPDMIRYFMTIPEAVQLVIQAGAMAKGGEIFVLDMGDPVKIMDLAKSIIKLSGFEPGKDIDIVITGMRPGEKLYEELLTAEEGVNATTHKRIYVAKPNNLNYKLIEEKIAEIMAGQLPQNQVETEMFLRQFIPKFKVWDRKLTG
ncbi:nucleoside-diphosphate sugar epimerase/dehydratase [Desulfofalx alkaliphila]|uniref:SDR family NAD(P)-dependent oxidoreductase n=1 Tax=Desulfofalx alkaliphila TaxID=105483 RepID=UPI0004E25DD2